MALPLRLNTARLSPAAATAAAGGVQRAAGHGRLAGQGSRLRGSEDRACAGTKYEVQLRDLVEEGAQHVALVLALEGQVERGLVESWGLLYTVSKTAAPGGNSYQRQPYDAQPRTAERFMLLQDMFHEWPTMGINVVQPHVWTSVGL
jgi:hypothetical protein